MTRLLTVTLFVSMSHAAHAVPIRTDGDGNARGPWHAKKVEHFGLVLRSGQPNHEQLEHLKERRGLRSVVSLRLEGEGDGAVAHGLGLRLLRLKIHDGGTPTTGQAVKFLDFVTKHPNEPVLVHCRAGVGRTGEMIAAYRIAVDRWNVDRALDEAHRNGMKNPYQDRWVRDFNEKVEAGEIPHYKKPYLPLTVSSR